MKHSKGRKIYIALSSFSLAAVMAIIFILSAQNGEDSSSTSGFFANIIEIITRQPADDDLIRIMAHFCEFAGLSFLMCNFIFSLKDKLKPVLSILLSLGYAVTDEIHQYFVPGRACQLTDVAIDLCGIVLGVALFCFLFFLKCKVKKSKT